MNKNERNKRRTVKKKQGHIWLYLGMGLIMPAIMVYILISLYFSNHYYPKTIINGVDASNMTLAKAEEAINATVASYVLSLKERNDITDNIDGKSIELHTEFDTALQDTLPDQNSFLWPVSMFRTHKVKVKTMLRYNEDLLDYAIKDLNCLKKENLIEPENAHISEYGEDGSDGFTIVPEVQGSKVIEKKLASEIKNSILALKNTFNLEEAGCYEEPEIKSDNKDLQIVLKKMNKVAGAKITYEFGDKTEVVDGSRISKWITVDQNLNVILSKDGVKEFVDYIGKNYNSFGRIRTFQTSYDKVIKVEGGDYGWWLDRTTELKELYDLIVNGEKVKREPVYFQVAQQYGDNDIGNTYVEINLTAQHMYFYKDGKQILDADIVSGNESKKLGTPVGTYPIQYTERNATLVGEDYTTPVNYWMPFNKNIGLHDASWRSKFGKDIYLTNGSHGCINMPPAKAKELFGYVKRGVPVVVYKLKGTENYDTQKNTGEQTKPEVKDTPTGNTDNTTGNTTDNTADSASNSTVKKAKSSQTVQ